MFTYFGGPPALELEELPAEEGAVELLLGGVELEELCPLAPGVVPLGGDCVGELPDRGLVCPGVGLLMDGAGVVAEGFVPLLGFGVLDGRGWVALF